MPTIPDYETLVEQEDMLAGRIETCEETIDAVLEMLYKKESSVHLQTVSEIVSAMHEVQVKLERELLLLKVEKRLVARNLGRKPS